MHDSSDLRDLLRYELAQRRESGFEIGSLEGAATDALGEAGGPDDERLLVHLERLEAEHRSADWPFVEVDDASEQVRLVRSPPPRAGNTHPPLISAIACWAPGWVDAPGCLLGKPVEGWTAEEIRRYLEHADAWPLDGYVPALDPHPTDSPPMKPSWPEATRGAIDGMARDDDLDYTVVGLLLLERTGGEPTAERCGRRVARAVARRPDLHRGTRRLPKPPARPPASSIRLASQSLPRVDRRIDTGGCICVRVARRSDARRRAGRPRCLRVPRRQRRRGRNVGSRHDQPRARRRAALRVGPRSCRSHTARIEARMSRCARSSTSTGRAPRGSNRFGK